MQTTASTARASKPPPLWFVTNGDVTVGPVTTTLLLRGVLHERVPDHCLVRERKSRTWRSLDRVREIAALRKVQARGPIDALDRVFFDPAAELDLLARLPGELLRARDPEDVLVRCLMEGMKATGACVGAVHRRRPMRGFVTTCVAGPGTHHRLDRALAEDDPVLVVAREGRSLCEAPRPGAPSGVVQERLGELPACSGVAMAPVVCSGRLYAILELGRPDHTFRNGDFQRVLRVAALAADRLGVVRNAS